MVTEFAMFVQLSVGLRHPVKKETDINKARETFTQSRSPSGLNRHEADPSMSLRMLADGLIVIH
ncbi:hypothetical protein KIN20_025877 [Parelaphostrongylus tenuis]|uniref:Uncharacterized protein n=1 Tax=Parelaphostrongylus tenuis TaxID=148309 RepID=A0AAD5QXE3_PARTN|nr:hypothetical protein KIN20_025877 [Parelaphostrongylus tenuis]